MVKRPRHVGSIQNNCPPAPSPACTPAYYLARCVHVFRGRIMVAEATTFMSSFRMGQLRLQRVVARVYECARLA